MKEKRFSREDETLVGLLNLDGEIFPMDNGYWTKFEAWRLDPEPPCPTRRPILSDPSQADHGGEMKGRKMAQKVLHIGIMPYQDYKKRSLAIARGEYRPRPNEPKIWFESVRSMAQVLSNENQVLLKTILERKPESLKELEAATGRSSSNLSRTLKTMARYGIVRMEKVRRNIRPVVEATNFTVQFGLYASSRRERGAGAVRI